ncbi:MAG: carbohydrate ABC transporter permease [Spirochaetaceae bacterium]|nr:carbohydrate ABC transporter permease [Spirochaetaceae bacterium]
MKGSSRPRPRLRGRFTPFDAANAAFMVFVCAGTLYPFLFIIASSLSSYNASVGGLSLVPRAFTLDNFSRVLTDPLIYSGLRNTIARTAFGTVLSLIAVFALAYPLSKKYLPNRGFWTGLVVLTMFFSGGLIPTYLLVRAVGLVDSPWSLVLPELVGAYNLIIARNYMRTIPDSLEESARIDGANDMTILFKIILPVCKPIVATIALWIAVWHWNAWFDCLVYMTKPEGEVLQLVMRRIVIQGSDQLTEMLGKGMAMQQDQYITPEGLKAATILVTTFPILCAYPFIQKYFVKGVMVGSLKG